MSFFIMLTMPWQIAVYVSFRFLSFLLNILPQIPRFLDIKKVPVFSKMMLYTFNKLSILCGPVTRTFWKHFCNYMLWENFNFIRISYHKYRMSAMLFDTFWCLSYNTVFTRYRQQNPSKYFHFQLGVPISYYLC